MSREELMKWYNELIEEVWDREDRIPRFDPIGAIRRIQRDKAILRELDRRINPPLVHIDASLPLLEVN